MAMLAVLSRQGPTLAETSSGPASAFELARIHAERGTDLTLLTHTYVGRGEPDFDGAGDGIGFIQGQQRPGTD